MPAKLQLIVLMARYLESLGTTELDNYMTCLENMKAYLRKQSVCPSKDLYSIIKTGAVLYETIGGTKLKPLVARKIEPVDPAKESLKWACPTWRELYNLTKKNASWISNTILNGLFNELKDALSAQICLSYHDPNKEIFMATDASSSGGSRSYVYLTLNEAESRYSQSEKEALAIIYVDKKLQQYLYGSHFTFIADHQLLTKLFSGKLISERMYKHLSRRPIQITDEGGAIKRKDSCKQVNIVHKRINLSMKMLQNETFNDQTLSRVIKFMRIGWHDKEMIPDEITPKQIMWNNNIIVPGSFRTNIFAYFHKGHQGIQNMKNLAREQIWWPHINQQIEEYTPLLTSESSSERWEKLHKYLTESLGRKPWLIFAMFAQMDRSLPLIACTSKIIIKNMLDAFSRNGKELTDF
ncbi:hypothetical protein RF11_13333 [Thelohanellus kitauei]|uniref:Reverse transcriptase RNase H-like domain-containing protein n=1 Tax=Thelohanellus kitauei TaxID=669202 RepID=A0A0C2NDM6_THEKT|nr:hypothetical protein RF11_13333 [Thelohanellus kitauei]